MEFKKFSGYVDWLLVYASIKLKEDDDDDGEINKSNNAVP